MVDARFLLLDAEQKFCIWLSLICMIATLFPKI